eukprot:GHVN01011929.1.p1 GENE.GHVN01011929.1~~GHVN01011929.1.p1  ORF type:complete len:654 (-),score=101.76 GHVN01011929.1:927-2888(-)
MMGSRCKLVEGCEGVPVESIGWVSKTQLSVHEVTSLEEIYNVLPINQLPQQHDFLPVTRSNDSHPYTASLIYGCEGFASLSERELGLYVVRTTDMADGSTGTPLIVPLRKQGSVSSQVLHIGGKTAVVAFTFPSATVTETHDSAISSPPSQTAIKSPAIAPVAPPARPPGGLAKKPYGVLSNAVDAVMSDYTTTGAHNSDTKVNLILVFPSTEAASHFSRTLETRLRMGDDDYRYSAADGSAESHLTCMDRSTVDMYFQYYGKMSNQYNMLQDMVRTSIYNKAITSNRTDFEGKCVMDVGAGSGILSFFCAQAGANRVYSVEASSMSEVIRDLKRGNPYLGAALTVIQKTVESVTVGADTSNTGIGNCNGEPPNDEFDIPQKVDVLVSEPIGTFVFNERMIESYLYARDKFLKPGGKMYPNRSRLYLTPFTDSALHSEVAQRGQFWKSQDFYGISLEEAAHRANEEQFRQPIVDHINPAILVTSAVHIEEFDFTTIPRNSLERICFDFDFEMTTPSLIHGFAGWFDVLFEGSNTHVGFTTAPNAPPTHWYQIRFLLRTPLAVNAGQRLTGTMVMEANSHQSYYIDIKAMIQGTPYTSSSATLDLKDPDYRYYSNPSSTFFPMGVQSTDPVVVAATADIFQSTQPQSRSFNTGA